MAEFSNNKRGFDSNNQLHYEEKERTLYETNDLDQEDIDNLDAIDRELGEEGFYEDEDDKQMDELEKEMEISLIINEVKSSTTLKAGVVPSGAMPSRNGVLSSHAAEFWFPESRNCPCCKGFKHGCQCCTSNITTCKNADCENQDFKAQISADLASRPSTNTSPASKALPITKSYEPSSIISTGPEVCKFFVSGGCHYGNTCRFSHPGVTSIKPISPYADMIGGGPPSNICVFYLQGKCNKGVSCRFSHSG